MAVAEVVDKVPTVDVSRFLSRAEGYQSDCEYVAQLLAQYGLFTYLLLTYFLTYLFIYLFIYL